MSDDEIPPSARVVKVEKDGNYTPCTVTPVGLGWVDRPDGGPAMPMLPAEYQTRTPRSPVWNVDALDELETRAARFGLVSRRGEFKDPDVVDFLLRKLEAIETRLAKLENGQ